MRLADLGRNVMFYFGPLSTVKQLRAAILDHILTTKGADLTNEGKEKIRQQKFIIRNGGKTLNNPRDLLSNCGVVHGSSLVIYPIFNLGEQEKEEKE